MILKIDKKFTPSEIEKLKKMIQEQPTGFLIPVEPIVKHLKVKKDVPTVIEYQGRRYVLDHKGGEKKMERLDKLKVDFNKQMKKQSYDNSGRKTIFIDISTALFQIVEEQQKEIEELKERLRLSDFRSNY